MGSALLSGECQSDRVGDTMYKRLLMILVLAIVERAGLGLSLSHGFVTASLTEEKTDYSKVVWFAFFAGIILDLVFATSLGLTSLLLVVSRVVIVVTRDKFEGLAPVVLVLVFLSFSGLLNYLQYGVIRWVSVVGGLLFGVLTYWWMRRAGFESWDGQVFLKK